MTTKIDGQIQDLRKFIEERLGNNGATINVIPGEGTGKSSCIISRGAKGGESFEVKVYSNDLTGAMVAVGEALQQYRRIVYELQQNGNGIQAPKEDDQ